MKLAIRLLINRLTSALGQVPFQVPVKGGFAGNATEVVFLLHSSQARPILHYLDRLCNQRLTGLLPKYPPSQLWPAGILIAYPVGGWGYNIVTDNANETISIAAPPTLRGTIAPRSADETPYLMARSLPEYEVEVAP